MLHILNTLSRLFLSSSPSHAATAAQAAGHWITALDVLLDLSMKTSLTRKSLFHGHVTCACRHQRSRRGVRLLPFLSSVTASCSSAMMRTDDAKHRNIMLITHMETNRFKTFVNLCRDSAMMNTDNLLQRITMIIRPVIKPVLDNQIHIRDLESWLLIGREMKLRRRLCLDGSRASFFFLLFIFFVFEALVPRVVLSMFVRRGCAVFQVSFSPIFSRTGYQKKANFLEQVVKTCQKRKFCYNGLFFSPIFVFLSILFTDFF